MSDRKLTVLGVVAVIMVGLAIVQNRISQHGTVTDFGNSLLIEGLDIEAVATIEIQSEKGEKTTTLTRNGGVFVVAEKENYPADVTKINTLINNCLDIRIHEMITENPENHADLKVTKETARYVVAFMDRDGDEIVGLAMSESDENRNAFVRLLSGNEVYSVQGPPMIYTSPMDYVDTQLLELKQDQIASVAVRTPEDTYILSSSQDSDEIQLDDLPAGKQYKGTTYQTVFRALNYLRFDDVMKADNAPEDLSFDWVYTCKLYDQTVYKLVLAKKDDKTYVTVSADFLDKSPVEVDRRGESEEKLKEKEAKLLAIDNVNTFNQKHQGWVYQIPSYKAGDLTKLLSELIEDIPEPAEPEAAAQNEAADSGTEAHSDPNVAVQ